MTSTIDPSSTGRLRVENTSGPSRLFVDNPVDIQSHTGVSGYLPDVDETGKEKWPREEKVWKEGLRAVDKGRLSPTCSTPRSVMIVLDISLLTRLNTRRLFGHKVYHQSYPNFPVSSGLQPRRPRRVLSRRVVRQVQHAGTWVGYHRHEPTTVAHSPTQLNWNNSQLAYTRKRPKHAYYLCIGYLMGHTFDNALLNLGLRDQYREGVDKLGFNLEDPVDQERDVALGKGGLGHLTTCYLDSSSSQELPVWGYSLRYKYGIFQQLIAPDGSQLEAPDPWLEHLNPFEIPHYNVQYEIRFYGQAERTSNGRAVWSGG